MKLQVKKMHHSRKVGRPCIDTSKTHHQGKVRMATDILACQLLHPHERWVHFHGYCLQSYQAHLWKGDQQASRLIWGSLWGNVIHYREDNGCIKGLPLQKDLWVFQDASSTVQQCQAMCQSLLASAVCPDTECSIKRMFEGIKKVLGPTQKTPNKPKTDTLRSTQSRPSWTGHQLSWLCLNLFELILNAIVMNCERCFVGWNANVLQNATLPVLWKHQSAREWARCALIYDLLALSTLGCLWHIVVMRL